MKKVLSISNTRKELPCSIRETQRNAQAAFQISVCKETIAERWSTKSMGAPEEAVRKLINLRKELSKGAKNKKQEIISCRIKEFLYP